jgi:hypothetical protein
MVNYGVMQISPFMSMMIGLLFTFSTIYGLMFYFFQGDAQTVQLQGLNDTANNASSSISDTGGFLSSFIAGTFDSVLSFVAWVSPFALIRAAIFAVTPTDLFTVLDIFLLRPMSWAVSIITGNMILSFIRGRSEGT